MGIAMNFNAHPQPIPINTTHHHTKPNALYSRFRTLASSRSIALAAVCAIAIIARLTLFSIGPAHDTTRAFYGDSTRYVELANNLITHNTFGIDQEDAGVIHIPLAKLRTHRGEIERPGPNGLRPEILRTPGYPFFIATLLKTNLPLNTVLITQCLISTGSVLLVYLLGFALVRSHRTALIAALLIALNPADILVANGLLSETLFTAVMLLGLWLAVAFAQQNPIIAATSGFTLGLAVLIRPIAVFLGPAIGIWMIATNRQLKTLIPALAITISSLMPAAAWAMRNNSVGFGYRISSIPFISNFFYTGAYVRITGRNQDTRNHWPPTVSELLGELETNIQPNEDVFAAMNRLTLQIIIDNPLIYAKVIANSMIKLMTDHSMNDLYRTLGWEYQPTGLRDKLLNGQWAIDDNLKRTDFAIALCWTAFNAALTIATFAGLIYLATTRQWTSLLLIGGVIIYFLITVQALGLERLRVPIIGLQAICIASIAAPRQKQPKPSIKKSATFQHQHLIPNSLAT